MEEVKFSKEEAGQMVEYIQLTSDLIDKQAAEIKQLEEQVQENKQASEETPVLSEEKIATTVSGLIDAGLAKEGERKQLIEHFKEPENLLNALDKIASLRVKKNTGTVPPMGKVASAGTVAEQNKRESDAQFERQFG
jgi:hypothetical protein